MAQNKEATAFVAVAFSETHLSAKPVTHLQPLPLRPRLLIKPALFLLGQRLLLLALLLFLLLASLSFW